LRVLVEEIPGTGERCVFGERHDAFVLCRKDLDQLCGASASLWYLPLVRCCSSAASFRFNCRLF
jgi:hypothetical protein